MAGGDFAVTAGRDHLGQGDAVTAGQGCAAPLPCQGSWLCPLDQPQAVKASSRYSTFSMKHQGSTLVSDGIGNHDAARVAVGGRILVTVLEIP